MADAQKADSKNFETTRFHHFEFAGGHVTVAYEIDENKDATNRRVRYGCSFTSPRDTFNRAKGRMIAAGRLNYLKDKANNYRTDLMASEINIDVTGEKPLQKILDTVRQNAMVFALQRCPWARRS